MAIPKYDELYPDFLTALISGTPRPIGDIRREIARRRQLTDRGGAARDAERPDHHRVCQPSELAGVYLRKAGLITRPSRGTYQITELGRQAIFQTDTPIDNHYLMRFTDFRDFFNSTQSGTDTLKSEPIPNTHRKHRPRRTAGH